MKRSVLAITLLLAVLRMNAQTVVWSDDFSDPTIWSTYHEGPVALDWQIGIGLNNTGPSPTSPIQSTTAANGYAMLDSDGGPGSPGGPEESSWMRSAVILDLSVVPYPTLRFQTHYRHAAQGQCYVTVSTDGGATWPILIPLFIGLNDGDSTANPLTVELDISSAISADPSFVRLGFHWIGPQGYSWFIDDIEIIDGPPLPCNSEFVISQANDGLGQPIPFVLNINYNMNGGISPFIYAWDFGDGSTSTDPYPTHTYATNGPYEICLSITDDIGCTSTFCDSIMVDPDGLFSRLEGFTVQVMPAINTSILNMNAFSRSRIYPNPVMDLLTIIGISNTASRTGRITDVLGQLVMETSVSNGVIDVSSLPPGSYVIRTDNTIARFVKQ